MKLRAALAFSLFCFAVGVHAQDYPSRPVRLVVPFPPGGSTDISGRLIAERLSVALKQPFVVENRPGANGLIGAEAVARAPADGYTILLGNLGVMAINPAIRTSMPYSPQKDFTPAAMLAVSPLILIASTSSGIKTAQDIVAKAKAQPDKLSYSSAGIGSASHMASELFNYLTGIRTTHIPYGGAAPGTAAVASGEVAYGFSGQGSSWPMVKAGKVVAVALTGAARSPENPDTPTVKESGVNYETVDWFGLLFPAGTPREVLVRINSEVNKILSAPEVRRVFAGQGLEPSPRSIEQFSAFIKAEQEKWDQVAKTAKIRAE